MPADTLDPARLSEHVAEAKSAWRKHARALTWEQKVAAIERMRERAAPLKAARDAYRDRLRGR
jgi:phage shock protein A